MRYKYYNANPLKRKVSDCTVRAIATATGRTWDETYEELSKFAQEQAIILDDVIYIDSYLDERYERLCGYKNKKIPVGDFVDQHPIGTYLITMSGHITCCIDGCIYDTFNPEDRFIWDVYKVK